MKACCLFAALCLLGLATPPVAKCQSDTAKPAAQMSWEFEVYGALTYQMRTLHARPGHYAIYDQSVSGLPLSGFVGGQTLRRFSRRFSALLSLDGSYCHALQRITEYGYRPADASGTSSTYALVPTRRLDLPHRSYQFSLLPGICLKPVARLPISLVAKAGFGVLSLTQTLPYDYYTTNWVMGRATYLVAAFDLGARWDLTKKVGLLVGYKQNGHRVDEDRYPFAYGTYFDYRLVYLGVVY